MSPPAVRVASWNILGRRVARTNEVAGAGSVSSTVSGLDLDVLCLQEVHFYDEAPDRQLISELEAAGLDKFYGLPLSESHLDEAARLGVGIASRWPIEPNRPYILSNPGGTKVVAGREWFLHDKGMVGCDVKVAGVVFQVYSLHLFPFHEFGVDERDSRVDAMWREFWDFADRAAKGGNLILAGDFNHETRVDAAQRWSRNDWFFCLGDKVTTSTGLSLDEIALSCRPVAAETQVISTFSDHHLVVADLKCGAPAKLRTSTRKMVRGSVK